jgi:hypothetical protein
MNWVTKMGLSAEKTWAPATMPVSWNCPRSRVATTAPLRWTVVLSSAAITR